MSQPKPIPLPTAGGAYRVDNGRLVQTDKPTAPPIGKTAARKAAEAQAADKPAKADKKA